MKYLWWELVCSLTDSVLDFAKFTWFIESKNIIKASEEIVKALIARQFTSCWWRLLRWKRLFWLLSDFCSHKTFHLITKNTKVIKMPVALPAFWNPLMTIESFRMSVHATTISRASPNKFAILIHRQLEMHVGPWLVFRSMKKKISFPRRDQWTEVLVW